MIEKLNLRSRKVIYKHKKGATMLSITFVMCFLAPTSDIVGIAALLVIALRVTKLSSNGFSRPC